MCRFVQNLIGTKVDRSFRVEIAVHSGGTSFSSASSCLALLVSWDKPCKALLLPCFLFIAKIHHGIGLNHIVVSGRRSDIHVEHQNYNIDLVTC